MNLWTNGGRSNARDYWLDLARDARLRASYLCTLNAQQLLEEAA